MSFISGQSWLWRFSYSASWPSYSFILNPLIIVKPSLNISFLSLVTLRIFKLYLFFFSFTILFSSVNRIGNIHKLCNLGKQACIVTHRQSQVMGRRFHVFHGKRPCRCNNHPGNQILPRLNSVLPQLLCTTLRSLSRPWLLRVAPLSPHPLLQKPESYQAPEGHLLPWMKSLPS